MTETIIFFDLETTGLDVAKDRIVEIACIKFDKQGNTTEKHTLVNPGIPIPAEATEIHGITDEMVAQKPTFQQLSKSLLSFLSDSHLAGFNSNAFDVPMLYCEFLRAGIDWDYKANFLIDICNIFRRKESRDLTAAMKFYCNEELTGAHSALIDAKATMKVFAEQMRRYDFDGTEAVSKYSCYDNEIVDLGGWFTVQDGNYVLAKGKSKGSRDKGFIEWMLKLPDLFPDAKKICYQILNEDK